MEITNKNLLNEFKWRSLLGFIEYDWDNSKKWKEY